MGTIEFAASSRSVSRTGPWSRGTLVAAVRPRATMARVLVAIASRLSPPARDSSPAPAQELLRTLDRLAQLDAEMHRLRADCPVGWANTLASYAAEAGQLRRKMALEFKKDDLGRVFLVRGDSAVYYLRT